MTNAVRLPLTPQPGYRRRPSPSRGEGELRFNVKGIGPMKTLFTALILTFVSIAAQCAEAAAEKVKGRSIQQWVTQLGSDAFSDREEATAALSTAGAAAIPALKLASESGDNEVRVRAKLVLAAQEIVSFQGQFVRVKTESTDSTGNRIVQSNEEGESILNISKGRVIFKQDYRDGVTQVYSFNEKTPLTFKNYRAIDLTWESINLKAGYFPDSSDPKLECSNTESGLRIVFSATDTQGTSFKMTFAPKPEHTAAPAQGEKPKKKLIGDDGDFGIDACGATIRE